MIQIAKLSPRILEDLRSRGHSDADIQNMSPENAFDEFVEWQGLRSYGPLLRKVIKTIEEASK